MKFECPHCHKSLEGRFIRLSKVEQVKQRSCPHCGGEIEHRIYRHELFTRAFTILVAVAAGYWISRGGLGGVLQALVAALAVLGIAYGIERVRLRNVQRYQKGRTEQWKPKLEPLE